MFHFFGKVACYVGTFVAHGGQISRATGSGRKPHVPGMNTRLSVFCIQYAAHHEKVLFAQMPPNAHPIISANVSASEVSGARNSH